MAPKHPEMLDEYSGEVPSVSVGITVTKVGFLVIDTGSKPLLFSRRKWETKAFLTEERILPNTPTENLTSGSSGVSRPKRLPKALHADLCAHAHFLLFL